MMQNLGRAPSHSELELLQLAKQVSMLSIFASVFLASSVKKSEETFETKSKIPHAPSHYFEHSEFWYYADKGAMENWTYCFSRLRSQEEIFSHIYK